MDGALDHVAHQPAVTLAHLARLDALAHERDQRLLVRGRVGVGVRGRGRGRVRVKARVTCASSSGSSIG